MATDRHPPDDAEDNTAWLDGLAGRPGAGAAHGAGARLRGALLHDEAAATPPAPWATIVQQAARPPGAAQAPGGAQMQGAAPPVGALQPGPARAAEAANQARWHGRPAWAAAAAVLVGVGLGWAVWQHDGAPSAEWRGSAPAAMARWQVDDPAAESAALADALTGLGATVRQTQPGGTTVLMIEVPEQARPAVNARLAPLDLALDADGRLAVQVLPR